MSKPPSFFFKKKSLLLLSALLVGIFVTVFSVQNLGILRQYQANASALTTPYTDPSYMTKVNWGWHSHWIQPWRAYMETVPATDFVNGVGMHMNLSSGDNYDLNMKMLATHGVKHVRIEQGWGQVNYNDENVFNNTASFQKMLLAAKSNGLRPLILLNSHHGTPTPTLFVNKTLPNGAAIGDTTVTLNDITGLIPGYSGLSDLTTFWAAEAIITEINGNVVTLSKPMPKAFTPGATVKVGTLKYRPFSPTNTTDYADTVAGWKKYVTNVANFAATTLGTTNSADKGFDMEIWNELTFGSNFTNVNKYYSPALYPTFDAGTLWGPTSVSLVHQTASHVDANPAAFTGVQLTDGFANTIPWPASTTEPTRVTAISKHPYSSRRNFPSGEVRPQYHLNALGQADPYIPTYTELFPEYFGTFTQTESLLRDAAPINNSIGANVHGRNARTGSTVPVWITEVNEHPLQSLPGASQSASLNLKAKSAARYLAFYLNKGVARLYFFAAGGGDTSWGMILDSFITYAKQPGAVYPADDSSYTSPALKTIQRMITTMQTNMDSNLTLSTTRKLTVLSVSDTHNHFQFQGDGTAAHPNLFNRDVLAILPFQSNSTRFVIPYYVMTRDFTKNLPPEQFTIQLQGINGQLSSATAYDPINDVSVPVSITGRTSTTITLVVTATDYPYMLTIQEDSINPTVTITNPLNNAAVIKNSTVNIAATASDNIGVANVKFYQGTTLLCTDTTSPYNCSWVAPKRNRNSLVLKATATDNAGNTSTHSINVSVR